MTRDEEKLVFLIDAAECHLRARRILEEATGSDAGLLRDAAIEMALIEYAKPFRTSRGIHGRLRLDDDAVPETHRKTHDITLTMRDQVLAHLDMAPKDALLSFRTLKGADIRMLVETFVKPIFEDGGPGAVIALITAVQPSLQKEIAELEIIVRPA